MKKNLVKGALLLSMVTIGFSPALTTQAKTTPKLAQKKVTIKVGQKKKLKIKGTRKKVRWSSNKKKIVTVSPKGVLKGKKAGKAIVTAKVGKKKFKCKVTVNKGNPSLNAKSITLKKGGSYKLKVKNGTGVKWSSNNKGVATVSSKGVVKARKAGKATITAKVGKKKLTCKVTVKKANNKSDKGNGGKVNISKDEKKQLPYGNDVVETYLYNLETLPLNKPTSLFSYIYQGATKIHVTSNLVKANYYKWFSSDNSILSINRYGVATAHREGKVRVYFKYMTKSGKWETSSVANIKVKDVGNISFSYKIGYDEDLFNKSTLPGYYTKITDNPELMNYITVTITNNSKSEIQFKEITCNPGGKCQLFKAVNGEIVTIHPGETVNILCNEAYAYDPFDRAYRVKTVIDFKNVERVTFNYCYKGKNCGSTHYIVENYWDYYC